MNFIYFSYFALYVLPPPTCRPAPTLGRPGDHNLQANQASILGSRGRAQKCVDCTRTGFTAIVTSVVFTYQNRRHLTP